LKNLEAAEAHCDEAGTPMRIKRANFHQGAKTDTCFLMPIKWLFYHFGALRRRFKIGWDHLIGVLVNKYLRVSKGLFYKVQ